MFWSLSLFLCLSAIHSSVPQYHTCSGSAGKGKSRHRGGTEPLLFPGQEVCSGRQRLASDTSQPRSRALEAWVSLFPYWTQRPRESVLLSTPMMLSTFASSPDNSTHAACKTGESKGLSLAQTPDRHSHRAVSTHVHQVTDWKVSTDGWPSRWSAGHSQESQSWPTWPHSSVTGSACTVSHRQPEHPLHCHGGGQRAKGKRAQPTPKVCRSCSQAYEAVSLLRHSSQNQLTARLHMQ